MPVNLREGLNKVKTSLKRGEEKVKTTLKKPETLEKKKAPSSAEIAKRKSRSDIFLIVGILSILIGFFTFLIPWIWGIPLTIAGLMMRRKEKRKGKRKEKLPFLTWITELSPIDRIKSKFVAKDHVLGDWGHLIEGAQGRAEEILAIRITSLPRPKLPTSRRKGKSWPPG